MTEKSKCPTTQEIFSDQIDKPMGTRITGTAMDVISLSVKKPCKIKLQLVEIVQVFVVEDEESFLNLYDFLVKNNYKNILVNKVDNTYTVTAQSRNKLYNNNTAGTDCPPNAVSACSNSSYSGNQSSCATSYLSAGCSYYYPNGCTNTICIYPDNGYCYNGGGYCGGCSGCS